MFFTAKRRTRRRITVRGGSCWLQRAAVLTLLRVGVGVLVLLATTTFWPESNNNNNDHWNGFFLPGVLQVAAFSPTPSYPYPPVLWHLSTSNPSSSSSSTTSSPFGFSSLSLSSSLSLASNKNNGNDIDSMSSPSPSSLSKFSWHALDGKRILVVGGSGRVGGSCVTQLLKRGAQQVFVGGTNRKRFEQAQDRWIRQAKEEEREQLRNNVQFVELNILNAASVTRALEFIQNQQSNNSDGTIEENNHGLDLVIHTAGPFQGKVTQPNGVLEACMAFQRNQQPNDDNHRRTTTGIPYLDVCDDYCTARAAKTKWHTIAETNQIPCIVSTGCWPGVSSLMARQMIHQIQQQDEQEQQHQIGSTKTKKDWDPQEWTVEYSFFTAGSGGAGVTLLVATFLILSEAALVVAAGRRTTVEPMRYYTTANFGAVVGDCAVAHLNLLETASIAENLHIGSVSSKFGTAPPFWNTLLGVMARVLPSSVLADEELMKKLSLFSLPIVRLVDFFAGATNAMRCDVTWTTPRRTDDNDTDDTAATKRVVKGTAIYAHPNLEPCVGECVAAFAAALLTGNNTVAAVVPPGIWFPEEAVTSPDDVNTVLQLASCEAHTYTTSVTTTSTTTSATAVRSVAATTTATTTASP